MILIAPEGAFAGAQSACPRNSKRYPKVVAPNIAKRRDLLRGRNTDPGGTKRQVGTFPCVLDDRAHFVVAR